jgi:hypothetical protein
MMSVVSRAMPNSICIGKPKDQCRLTPTVGDVVLKISYGRINVLFQPVDRL